jgi:hypothetical protein
METLAVPFKYTDLIPFLNQEIIVAKRRLAEITQLPPPPGDESAGGTWADPASPSDIAKSLGISHSTLKRRVKEGLIKVKKLTSKSWQIWNTK